MDLSKTYVLTEESCDRCSGNGRVAAIPCGRCVGTGKIRSKISLEELKTELNKE